MTRLIRGLTASAITAAGLVIGAPVGPLATAQPVIPGVGAAGAEREADFVIGAIAAGFQPTEPTGPVAPEFANLTQEQRKVVNLVLTGYLTCEVARAGASPNPGLFSVAQRTLCPDVVAPAVAPPPPAPPSLCGVNDPGAFNEWNGPALEARAAACAPL